MGQAVVENLLHFELLDNNVLLVFRLYFKEPPVNPWVALFFGREC